MLELLLELLAESGAAVTSPPGRERPGPDRRQRQSGQSGEGAARNHGR